MGQKAILEQVKNALDKQLDIHAVYLFGSRAKNTQTKDSDYDFAIVSPTFKNKSFLSRQRLVRPIIRSVIGVKSIDAACYTPEEFEEGKNAFLPMIIEKEGIVAP